MAKNKAHVYTSVHGGLPGSRTVLTTVLQLARNEANTSHYGQLVKDMKQGYCKACQAESRYATKRITKRTVLTEISANTTIKPRTLRTSYVCSECNIALCEKGPCWQEHLDALQR
jgi:hypothetical protein